MSDVTLTGALRLDAARALLHIARILFADWMIYRGQTVGGDAELAIIAARISNELPPIEAWLRSLR